MSDLSGMPLRLRLELLAREAVLAGGIAAMGHYRGALAEALVLDEGANASTAADLRATAAVLQSLDASLPAVVEASGLACAIFAEELACEPCREQSGPVAAWEQALRRLAAVGPWVHRSWEGYERAFGEGITVLFDALDGTSSFRAGIPLFCSALAVFLEGQPLAAAIYDPLHHVVYYGSLGPSGGRARMWTVPSGSDVALPVFTGHGLSLVGTHLTRSVPSQRRAFAPALQRLSQAFDGSYLLNSGQLALAYVAAGSLAAFVNNCTHPWDVAAGEVLVRAIGGAVTDFLGRPIHYAHRERVQVAAASSASAHRELLAALAEPGSL